MFDYAGQTMARKLSWCVYTCFCLSLVAGVFAPLPARASSCFAPGQLTATIPGTNETLAHNGAVYLTGRHVSLEQVDITDNLGIRYEAVTIATLGPRMGVTDGETVVVVLEPQPDIGKEVTLTGNFCHDGDMACDYTLVVTIGEEDPEILLPPTDLPPEAQWRSTELESISDCEDQGDPEAGGCRVAEPSGLAGGMALGMLVLGLRWRRRRAA